MNLVGFLLLMSPCIFVMVSPGVNKVIQNSGKIMYMHKNGTIEEINFFKTGVFYDLINNDNMYDVCKFLVAFVYSIIIVLFLISRKLYGNKIEEDISDDESNSEDEDEYEEHEDEENNVVYESQYFDQLEEMPDKQLTTEELKSIGSHRLIEETPKGTINMGYNVDNETFEYYTDKFTDISYEILDTVARLFTITFQCKQICINYRKEIEEGENNMLSEIEYDNMMKEKEADREKNQEKEKERSVFAKFKTYNKKNGNNVAKKYYIITEKSNKFKYKGKLEDYEKVIKKESQEESNKNVKQISYADFKKLQEDMKLQQEYIYVEEEVTLESDIKIKSD
jgi:hypothetical protein